MTSRLTNVTFACEEPLRLADFWGEALGYVSPELPPEVMADIQRSIDAGELDPTAWAMRVPPDGAGPRLLFQRRPKSETESIPIHLDINADDAEAEVRRLVKLGGNRRRAQVAPNSVVRRALGRDEGPGRQRLLRAMTPFPV